MKQASQNWFEKFTSFIKNFGFRQSGSDYSLFTSCQGTSFVTILIYVDDVNIAGNDSHRISSLKNYLHSQFRIKDLGPFKYFSWDWGCSFFHWHCPRKYTLDILTEFSMLGAHPCSFPMEQQHKLSTDSGPSLPDPAQYRHLVGCLLYLTITRPNICYSVNILNQFMHDPCAAHLDAAMRILRYLKFTPG